MKLLGMLLSVYVGVGIAISILLVQKIKTGKIKRTRLAGSTGDNPHYVPTWFVVLAGVVTGPAVLAWYALRRVFGKGEKK